MATRFDTVRLFIFVFILLTTQPHFMTEGPVVPVLV